MHIRRDLFGFDFFKQRPDIGVFHTVCDGGTGQQLARVGDHLMACVQYADFHRLIGVHRIGEGRPHLVPIGASGAKTVLDDPLAERLMRDGGLIGDAHLCGFCDLCRAGGGDDAIHHGVWKRAVRRDPIRKLCIHGARKAKHGLAGDIAISLQVVAALHGERTSA